MQVETTTATMNIVQPELAAPPLLRKLLRFNPEFNLHRIGSPGRVDVETYIANAFARAYGAEVSQFAPYLMSMVCAGSVSAAAGVRPANLGPLFLEQYLDVPVERLLSDYYQTDIGRDDIFELGNLAALRPGVCQLLYLVMAGVMERTRMNHVVFAGTRQVAKGLAKLGFNTRTFAPAEPARLNGDATNWGSYYDNEPKIMAIDLAESMIALRKLALPSILLNIYEPQISELAAHFNCAHR